MPGSSSRTRIDLILDPLTMPDSTASKPFPCTWEEAIVTLRSQPEHRQLIHDAYLDADVVENCRRYAASDEFAEVLRLIRRYRPGARQVLDIPGGNGIATCALVGAGFEVTTVEPDPSPTVGRGAIERGLAALGRSATVVDAFGESLPFGDEKFDVVFVRQGLHHAQDLPKMVAQYARVLRPGGLLLACREHVVDNYGASLQAFLDSQPDHQLYGGENAFMLKDYEAALTAAGLDVREVLTPYASPINMHPNTPELLRRKILESGAGRRLKRVLPDDLVAAFGMWRLRNRRLPGRLFSFVATK